jgi:uncharacterized phiE125 gp8 family phage protein
MITGWRPLGRVVSIGAPAAPVVALPTMKEHCRVSHGEDDALLAAYQAAAVAAVEQWTQRLLTPRAVVLRLPGLPAGRRPIELPGGRVAQVASVVVAGASAPAFEVLGDSPALLVPDADWPVLTGDASYPVTITYTAGYSAPPVDLVHAVKMIAAEMYERRENAVEGSFSPAVVSAEYLMARHRIWAVA